MSKAHAAARCQREIDSFMSASFLEFGTRAIKRLDEKGQHRIKRALDMSVEAAQI
jgi:hypothetical protein